MDCFVATGLAMTTAIAGWVERHDTHPTSAFHVKQILKLSPSKSSAAPHDVDTPPGYRALPASNHRADPPAPPSAAAPLQAWSAPHWKARAHQRNRYRSEPTLRRGGRHRRQRS